MDQSLEGLGKEAERLPRGFAGGGEAFCIWAGGEGEISDVHADGRELHWVPC